MAYYSGTVASPAALKDIIETQCVTNGWSLSGGWLSKGSSHVTLTISSTTNGAGTFDLLNITGANSSDGLTTPAGITNSIIVKNTFWPVNYYLFIHNTPDIVVCVVNYNVFSIKMLMFGDLVKTHSSAYSGGNFFFASGKPTSANTDGFGVLLDSMIGLSTINISQINSANGGFFANIPKFMPFVNIPSDGAGDSVENNIHIEIDGAIWDAANKVSYTDTTIATLFRSPNSWNQQTHLIPMNLQYAMASNLYAYLGYIEHIRLVRVDNYEIGDIIEIAPDKWKVFPWIKKDVSNRNGSGVIPGHSGTIGFAVRYDGP